MKKLRNSMAQSYNRPLLFLEDLDRIVEVLGASGEEILFIDQEYEYDNYDDFKNNSPSPTNGVTIRCKDSGAKVIIGNCNVAVATDRDDVEAKSLLWELDQVLSAREIKESVLTSFPLLLGIVLFVMLLIFLRANTPTSYLITSTAWILFALPIVHMVTRIRQKPPLLYLSMKNENPSFYERNKDAIKVGLLVGIPVAVISVGGTLLGQKLYDSIWMAESPSSVSVPATSGDSNPAPDK